VTSLTGPGIVGLCILACVGLPLILAVCWNRVRRPWLAWPFRSMMILVSQLCAVLLAGVLLNDAFSFYSSWAELAGHQRPHVTSPSTPPGSQDQSLQPRIVRDARTGHGTVIVLTIPGLVSQVGSHPALVYLPPQYGDPAYRNRAFPVVELLPGYPGHPRNWVEQLAVARVLDRAIASGHVSPLIAVMPTSIVAPPRDTECVNVAHGPQVDTYLTTDVPAAISHDFRVQRSATGWAIMGYSTGGYCAVNLAMRHPDRYGAAVSMAGYNNPAHDHTTGDLFGGNASLLDQNSAVWRAQHLAPPALNLLLMYSYDSLQSSGDGQALAAAARPPLHVDVLGLAHGGHNFEVWLSEEPTAFSWLSTHLTPPLAPIPTVDGLAPEESLARHAGRR
jgi:S-formylglutathione hydrolase FrmB